MDFLLQHVGKPTTGTSFRRTKYSIETFIAISSHSLWGFLSLTQITGSQRCHLLGTIQTPDRCRNTLDGNVIQTEIREEEQQ